MRVFSSSRDINNCMKKYLKEQYNDIILEDIDKIQSDFIDYIALLSGIAISQYAGDLSWSALGTILQYYGQFSTRWSGLGRPSYSTLRSMTAAFLGYIKNFFKGKALVSDFSETTKFSREVKKQIDLLDLPRKKRKKLDSLRVKLERSIRDGDYIETNLIYDEIQDYFKNLHDESKTSQNS